MAFTCARARCASERDAPSPTTEDRTDRPRAAAPLALDFFFYFTSRISKTCAQLRSILEPRKMLGTRAVSRARAHPGHLEHFSQGISRAARENSAPRLSQRAPRLSRAFQVISRPPRVLSSRQIISRGLRISRALRISRGGVGTTRASI